MTVMPVYRPDPSAQAGAEVEADAADRVRAAEVEAELVRIRTRAGIEERRMLREERRERRTAGRRRVGATVRRVINVGVLLLPLVSVNAFATFGQVSFALEEVQHTELRKIGGGVPPALLWAVALESIALFLAHHAAKALRRGDSAAAKQAAAYGVAMFVAALNFAHFYGPSVAALSVASGFGLASAISPWLWGIHNRSVHRDELADRGEIPRRGLKLSPERWFWHPIRSIRVKRHASWHRADIRTEDQAVSAWEDARNPAETASGEAESEVTEQKAEQERKPRRKRITPGEPQVADLPAPGFEGLTARQALHRAVDALGVEATTRELRGWCADRGIKTDRSRANKLANERREELRAGSGAPSLTVVAGDAD